MLTGILQRFGWRPASPPSPERLPAELVALIEGAIIVFRQGEGDIDAVAVVKVAGLGSWKFDGIAETAERIGRKWPELSESCCRRAAQLVAAQVAMRNRQDMRGKPRGRSWVWDWDTQ